MSRSQDGDRGVLPELPRRVTAFPQSSTSRLTALLLSTRRALGDFTARSRRALRADFVHKAFLLFGRLILICTIVSERRAMVRTLCMFKMCASAWSSIMFKAIPPRQMPLRCYGAVSCVHLGVLRCLRTQRDRPEDAAQL